MYGRVHVARWLHESGLPNYTLDYGFRLACGYGHLELALWLHGLDGVDIHAYDDAPFWTACARGHLQVAKWLQGLGGVDVHTGNDVALEKACLGGHRATGLWLIGLQPDWAWPPVVLSLKKWGPVRDTWMRAVVLRG